MGNTWKRTATFAKYGETALQQQQPKENDITFEAQTERERESRSLNAKINKEIKIHAPGLQAFLL